MLQEEGWEALIKRANSHESALVTIKVIDDVPGDAHILAATSAHLSDVGYNDEVAPAVPYASEFGNGRITPHYQTPCTRR